MFENSTILITGGTGSFGHKFVPMVLEKFNPKKAILKVKETETILGKPIKKPNLDEIEVAKIARKKIIAKKEIKLGEIFTFQNLTTKRAHRGLSAINFWKVIGKRSKKNYKADDII